MSPLRRAALGLTVLIVAGAAVAAGCWQLRRLESRKARNAVFIARATLPVLNLSRDWHPGTPIDSGRRLLAQGRFIPDAQVVLRGRAQDGSPGLHVVTAFALDDDRGTLWVLRGFVRSPDAVTPPSDLALPDTGMVSIGGVAFDIPTATDSGQPLRRTAGVTYKRLDRAVLAAQRPGSLPVYLLLATGRSGAGRLDSVPIPPVTNGPHLGYAIQWFLIAMAVLLFGIIALWRDGRALAPRRAAP